jgi:hypothetical protein
MEEKRNAYSILAGKPEERGHWGNLYAHGSIKLRWILWK